MYGTLRHKGTLRETPAARGGKRTAARLPSKILSGRVRWPTCRWRPPESGCSIPYPWRNLLRVHPAVRRALVSWRILRWGVDERQC